MRIEILISNLLFGMTILTGALALAHLIGDFLMSGRNINPRIRKALRVLIASFSVAVCLAIFLNFSNAGMQRNFFSILRSDRPMFLPSPRLVVSDPAGASKGSPVNANFIDEERLQVLSERIPDEVLTLTEGETLQKFFASLPKVTALFSPDDKIAEDCASWHSLLTSYGLLQSENPTGQESKVLLGCSSAPTEHKQWQQIERDPKKHILLVGSAGDMPHKLISIIFPESTFATSAFQDDYAVALTGADLLSLPFPPGLRLFLGKEWMGRPGTVMSGVGSVSVVDSRWQLISGPSSVLRKSNLNGRRALWTSLPAKLYGKLQFSYDPYWKMIHRHMMSWLYAVPQSATSPLPMPVGQTVIKARTQADRKTLLTLSSSEALIIDSQAMAANDKTGGVPEIIVRYEPTSELHHTESPKVFFKKLQDSLAKERKQHARILLTSAIDGSLQYALEQNFTAVMQSVITDRPVPFVPATRHVKDAPEKAVPTTTALMMTTPEFESDASIGLRSHGATLIGVPSMQFVAAKTSDYTTTPSETAGVGSQQYVLSLSQYFAYWQQRAKITVGSKIEEVGAGVRRGQFVVTNTNNETLKSVAIIYSEADSIKIVESDAIKINPQQLAADVGVIVISELQPQAAVNILWEAK